MQIIMNEGDSQVLKHLDAQTLFDALPDAAVILDRFGKIKYLNSAAHNLFQYDIEEIKGHPIEVLVPARFRILHIAEREIFLRSLDLKGLGPYRKLIGLRKDGTECHVLVKISSICVDQMNWILCLVRDLTAIDELNQKACALHHHFQNMAWVMEAESALAPEKRLDPESMENFHDHLASLALNTAIYPSKIIPVKELLDSMRNLAQPHMERVAADLIIEEFRDEAQIHFRPTILIMALLGFIKLCAEAVAPLGERWVKVGLELRPSRLFLTLSDSAYSALDHRIGNELEWFVGAALLQNSGAEVLPPATSRSRFCVSVPVRTGAV